MNAETLASNLSLPLNTFHLLVSTLQKDIEQKFGDDITLQTNDITQVSSEMKDLLKANTIRQNVRVLILNKVEQNGKIQAHQEPSATD